MKRVCSSAVCLLLITWSLYFDFSLSRAFEVNRQCGSYFRHAQDNKLKADRALLASDYASWEHFNEVANRAKSDYDVCASEVSKYDWAHDH